MVAAAQAQYISGEIKTKETFKYGRFSTQMKAAANPGTVTSFFAYMEGSGHNPAKWNEIDIEIVPSIYKNPMSTNIIWKDHQMDQ